MNLLHDNGSWYITILNLVANVLVVQKLSSGQALFETVILTLKIQDTAFWSHTTEQFAKGSAVQNIEQKVIFCLIWVLVLKDSKPVLAWHSSSWQCTTTPSSVTKVEPFRTCHLGKHTWTSDSKNVHIWMKYRKAVYLSQKWWNEQNIACWSCVCWFFLKL